MKIKDDWFSTDDERLAVSLAGNYLLISQKKPLSDEYTSIMVNLDKLDELIMAIKMVYRK